MPARDFVWPPSDSPGAFSLVAGGPVYRMVVNIGLSGPALQPMHRLIAGATLLCWFPLLILTLAEGSFDRGAHIPFLYDLEVHTRLLCAVPLLIAGENIAHRLLLPIVGQFLDRNIVPPAERGRFEELVDTAMRLRNSVSIELIILAAAFGFGFWIWDHVPIRHQDAWYANESGRLTPAGYWYGFISLPILRFLLLRWYFRLAVWSGFLSSLRTLPLHLNLFHPDRAAGLGFLAASVPAFAPVLVAQSIMVSGMIGNRIWHGGMSLTAFRMEILGVALFLMLIVLAPLFAFTVTLAHARRRAQLELGTLASRYVDEFRDRWILSGGAPSESLLGSPDLQSLADLGGAYDIVNDTAAAPITKRTLAQLALVVLLPFAPLTLTLVPLDRMIDGVVKLLL